MLVDDLAFQNEIRFPTGMPVMFEGRFIRSLCDIVQHQGGAILTSKLPQAHAGAEVMPRRLSLHHSTIEVESEP